MAVEIHQITGIDIQALQGSPLSQFSVQKRLEWSEARKTKRVEDNAYCLLGIFSVSMSVIYGEGRDKAFHRLHKEIKDSQECDSYLSSQVSLANGRENSAPGIGNGIFLRAIQNFQVSLSPGGREMLKSFATPNAMRKDLEKKCSSSALVSRIYILSGRLEHCLNEMNEPLKTDDLGNFRGALHLVTMLASRYAGYDFKIASHFVRVSACLTAFLSYHATSSKSPKSDFTSSRRQKQQDRRLYDIPSIVCAHIVDFCLDLCRVLENHAQEIINATRRVELSQKWEPFDVKLSTMLDCLRSYQRIVQDEMQLRESRERERKQSEQASQPNLEEKIRRQVSKEVEQLKSLNDDLELKIKINTDKTNQIFYNRSGGKSSSEARKAMLEVLHLKIAQLNDWIDAPEYTQELNKARQSHAPKNGQYLLENSTYQRWKCKMVLPDAANPDTSRLELPRTLLLTGKPGFGKTVLSSIVIDDLNKLRTSLSGTLPTIDFVLFYHFVSDRRNSCSPYDAFRAMLAQILKCRSSDQTVLDQLLILLDADEVIPSRATDGQIFSALCMLLRGSNHSTLIFDGVDECSDHLAFLELTRKLCTDTRIHVLLLSRPNIDLPLNFEHQLINLRKSNLQDIQQFFETNVECWLERRWLPNGTLPEILVSTLISASEGVFLWASLMTRYLSRRALSPKERREAILGSGEFQGLHGIYNKMIQVLGKGYEDEKVKIMKIFSIVAVTSRPLLLTELQVALAVSPGAVTDPTSFIPDFSESLPIICEALIEVQLDGTVRFVHTSFRDYLLDGSSSDSMFQLNERSAHLCCSTILLSYLLYDLPLNGLHHGGNADAASLVVSFPLIRYSLKWVHHAVQGFVRHKNTKEDLRTKTQDDFYDMLSRFINERRGISVWIEAAWTFRVKPSVKALVTLRTGHGSDLTFSSPFSSGRMAIALLEELSKDLERLDEEWGYHLRQNPSAIWGPFITAFCKSEFWLETDATVVSSMLPSEAVGTFCGGSQRSILVQSQVSSRGDQLGIVLVIPSRSYLAAADTIFGPQSRSPHQRRVSLSIDDSQKLTKVCSVGWSIRYQRRDIATENLIMDLKVGLPESQIRLMLQQCLTAGDPRRFPFSVAFSHDLERLIVLRSVFIVQNTINPDSGQFEPRYRLQSLEGKDDNASKIDPHAKTTSYAVFSPNGKALALISGDSRPRAMECRRIQVWSDTTPEGSWPPKYHYRGNIMTSRLADSTHHAKNHFTFHPRLPIIVYIQWNTVGVWVFEGENAAKTTLKAGTFSSVWFNDEGDIMNYRGIKLERDIRSAEYPIGTSALADDESHEMTEKISDGEDYCPTYSEGYFEFGKFLQLSDSTQLVLTGLRNRLKDSYFVEDVKKLSSLPSSDNTMNRRVTNKNPVTNGSDLLTHLPQLRQGEETHISLLPCASQDKWLRMVWNKSAQDSYSIYDYQTPHLPSIIYRRQDTIAQIDDIERGPKRRRLE